MVSVDEDDVDLDTGGKRLKAYAFFFYSLRNGIPRIRSITSEFGVVPSHVTVDMMLRSGLSGAQPPIAGLVSASLGSLQLCLVLFSAE